MKVEWKPGYRTRNGQTIEVKEITLNETELEAIINDRLKPLLEAAQFLPSLVQYDHHGWFFCTACQATSFPNQNCLAVFVPMIDPFPHDANCAGLKFYQLLKTFQEKL